VEQMYIVRVYMAESDVHIEKLLKYLKETAKIEGVTVFRAISGYGESGKMHASSILYLSMDLPIVVEFYDKKEKIETTIEYFQKLLGNGHILCWPVSVY